MILILQKLYGCELSTAGVKIIIIHKKFIVKV